MKDLIYSNLTQRMYDPSECIRLVNYRQLMFYIQKGVEILDLYPSKDFKTGQDVLVFIVNRSDSRSVYEEWKELRIKKIEAETYGKN